MDNVCGTRVYNNITQAKINKMIQSLQDAGATVSGTNPWNINTNKYSITLNASWNPSTLQLSVIVTGKAWYVSCSQIWNTIDNLINGLGEDLLVLAGSDVCGTRSFPNIDEVKIIKMLAALRLAGATVTGDNPWTVSITKWFGTIVLGATWDKASSTLTLVVNSKPGIVSCAQIWNEISKLIGQLQLADNEAMLAASLCGSRTYPNITALKIDAMIVALRANGATVTGNNPWTIDVNQYGIVLSASRNATTNVLTLEVTAKAWYVPCSSIWNEIDKYMPHVVLLEDADIKG
jgi:hypothetical protein